MLSSSKTSKGGKYHSEEESGLVGLQRGLRVECIVGMMFTLGGYDGSGAQFLDELEGFVLDVYSRGREKGPKEDTFLRAL